MWKVFYILLVSSVSAAWAMGTLNPVADPWQPFHLSEGAFQPGYGADGTAIVVRDGYLPHRRSSGDRSQGRTLPEGTGAVAGICYMQISGGKLRATGGYKPMGGVPVTIRQGSSSRSVTTDAAGLFVAAVPPGEYDVDVAGVSRHVAVHVGKAGLVPVRVGKSMRD